MRYQAHNLLEEALEWAFLLSVVILSGLSSSGQAYPSKCCRQTCLLLWIQFRTEVYSLLSLGYFIHLWLLSGCYLANYRVLFMSGISVFGTSVQVQHRCAGPAQVCRSCTDIPYLVVWLFIQFSAANGCCAGY